MNFTLAPGESYTETFTLIDGESSGGYVVFGCSVITEDSSATIRWEYQIVKEGRNIPTNVFTTTFLTLTFIAIFSKIVTKNYKKQ